MTRVALFVTCLVDVVRPRIGFAATKLLEEAGCTVEVPRQSCCGQPNYNSGDKEGAARVARKLISALTGFNYVVAASGSCAAMVKCHYPALFAEGSADRQAAEDLAARTYELTEFLTKILKVRPRAVAQKMRATYHDSCSGLRELGIKQGPRELLRAVEGLVLTEMNEAEACCGFGGTFCVKYPDISAKITDSKIANIAASGADCVVAGDLGCILNIEGRLHREGKSTRVHHIAEVLAGMTESEA